MPSTDGMNSDYDDHSEYQRDVASTGIKLVQHCIESLTLPHSPNPVVIMDLGSATGGNSISVMKHAVETVRQRDPEMPIVCIHNDVLSNDWMRLFKNVADPAQSYLAVPGPAIIPMASATSFYDPTIPPGMAHLQTSFSAAHWLRSEVQVSDPNGMYFCETTGETRQQLADQAAADWQQFVDSRAKDIATGGFLVVQCIGTLLKAGGELVTGREILDDMTTVALSMADDNLLDRQYVDDFMFPIYARTLEEARLPFEQENSPFDIIEISINEVANPYLVQWQKDKDNQAYAINNINFVRGFAESTLCHGLFVPAVGEDRADTLSEEFFQRLEQLLANNPESHAFRDWTVTVVVRRR